MITKTKVGRKPSDDKPVELGFAFGGDIVDPKDSLSLAKTSHYDEKTMWFVKITTSGGDAGHLANPVSLNHATSDYSKVDRFGRNRYDYKQVTKEVFELYHKFLETRNIAWLRNAERIWIAK